MTAMRLAALELCDQCLDEDEPRHQLTEQLLGAAVAKQNRGAALLRSLPRVYQSLLEGALEALSEDADQPLRAQLLLRLDDPVRAAELALAWLPRWRDTEMCAAVALRSLSTLNAWLQQAHAAEPNADSADRVARARRAQQQLAHSYQCLLMFRVLEAAAHATSQQLLAQARAVKTGAALRGERVPSASTGPRPAELASVWGSWQALAEMVERDPERVVDQCLGWRMLGVALKVYSLGMIPQTDPEVAFALHTVSSGLPLASAEVPSGEQDVAARRRWWFGQDMLPLSLTQDMRDWDTPTLRAGVGLRERGAQLEFPLSLYSAWVSVMSAREAELKSTPEGFGPDAQAMQLRLAVKLESTCLALLLSREASARSHVRAMQRIHALSGHGAANSLQTFHILQYLLGLLDGAQARVWVTDLLHQRWKGTQADAAVPYPLLPRAEAQSLLDAHAASVMMRALPLRTQDALCTHALAKPDASGASLLTPLGVIQGLLQLGQPRLAASVFPRAKGLVSAAALIQRAKALLTGAEVDSAAVESEKEVGFYYLDLVLQCSDVEQELSVLTTAVLDVVQDSLAQQQHSKGLDSLTSGLMCQKLLRYVECYCLSSCGPEEQARYAVLGKAVAERERMNSREEDEAAMAMEDAGVYAAVVHGDAEVEVDEEEAVDEEEDWEGEEDWSEGWEGEWEDEDDLDGDDAL
jgi:hypothetical protein